MPSLAEAPGREDGDEGGREPQGHAVRVPLEEEGADLVAPLDERLGGWRLDLWRGWRHRRGRLGPAGPAARRGRRRPGLRGRRSSAKPPEAPNLDHPRPGGKAHLLPSPGAKPLDWVESARHGRPRRSVPTPGAFPSRRPHRGGGGPDHGGGLPVRRPQARLRPEHLGGERLLRLHDPRGRGDLRERRLDPLRGQHGPDRGYRGGADRLHGHRAGRHRHAERAGRPGVLAPPHRLADLLVADAGRVRRRLPRGPPAPPLHRRGEPHLRRRHRGGRDAGGPLPGAQGGGRPAAGAGRRHRDLRPPLLPARRPVEALPGRGVLRRERPRAAPRVGAGGALLRRRDAHRAAGDALDAARVDPGLGDRARGRSWPTAGPRP